MTIHELNFKLAMLGVQDPFTRDTYLNPHFAGNYTGTVRSNHFGKGYYLLDSTFDPNAFDVVEPGDLLRDLDLEDSKGVTAETTDVAFYVPSMGIYPILDIRRKKGDWGDGDGPYDYIELVCADEPDADDLIEGGDDDPINEDVGTVNVTFNYGDGDKDYDTGYIVQYADRYEVQSDLNMATGKTLEEMKANFEKEVESNLDYDVEDLFFDWNIEEELAESKKKVNEAVEDYIHPGLKAEAEYVPTVYYACYTLDDNGNEDDHFDDFDYFEAAVEECKQMTKRTGKPTHACVIITDEHDDEAYEFMRSYRLSNYEVVAEFSPDAGEALTEDVGEWHGMSREDIQDFAENSSEYWTGDDSWVEGIVQWLLDCNDEDVWNIVTSDNIDEDDDTFLMNEFMASDYCNE